MCYETRVKGLRYLMAQIVQEYTIVLLNEHTFKYILCIE